MYAELHGKNKHEKKGLSCLSSFSNSFLAIELVILVLWASWGDYSKETSGMSGAASTYPPEHFYHYWIGVHIMMLLGFGGLMQFLGKYGYSAIGFTFFLSCLALQWAILVVNFCHGVVDGHVTPAELDMAWLFQGDFAAGAVLISFGAVLGKTSASQLLWMCFLEVIFYAVAEAIESEVLMLSDAGGSIAIHTFGAFFGLAVSYVVTPKTMTEEGQDKDNTACYHSDFFSMLGTLFLFLYWPSFNGGIVEETTNAQHRALVNTVFALSASCIASFIMSSRLRPESKFCMVDIQNATLAGGVAVGASADMMLRPWGALLVGFLAGTVSTIGFARLHSYVTERLGVHDTCGILNLHGIPGVMGGIISAFVAALVPDSAYNGHVMYSGRVKYGRSSMQQAGYQLAGTFVTMAIAVATGLVTGYFLAYYVGSPNPGMLFTDEDSWEVPAFGVVFEAEKKHGVGARQEEGRASETTPLYQDLTRPDSKNYL